MSFLPVLWLACLLDLLFGDPRWFPHPVRLIGWFAAQMETLAGKLSLSKRNRGRLTVLLVLLVTGGSSVAILLLLAGLPRPLFFISSAFLLYTSIAARDLIVHAKRVYDALASDLDQARFRVAMIVGRDTDQLDGPGIIRACVESVAENMSDGIVAPLFWATAGASVAMPAGGTWPAVCGVTAAMLYKAINTMDSLFGYKNEQYREFGSCPARLDDVVNIVPARMSGLALVLASPFCGCSMKNSWTILKRDRAEHTSPNAGWPEAAAAGALGLALGGDSHYFGNLVTKPTLGDPLHPPSPDHILQANRLILAGSLLSLVCCTVVYLLVWFIV